MHKGERVHKFGECFDQIVWEHELSEDLEKLTKQEYSSISYQIIFGVMPEISRTDPAVVTTTGHEISMEALRKALRRIQEDNDADMKNTEVHLQAAIRV